ncbi:MAG: hypothetical protein RSF79_23365 [Janthinobacterium sp.]
MANNFFVSYDLMAPGQHYERVSNAIKATGDWAKVELSFFYVKSTMTVKELADHVWASMDSNDKLMVIDATSNDFYGYNLSPEVLKHMQERWNK